MHGASGMAMAMMHIEIGIEGSKVSGHSEVYKLLNEGAESFVSLENDVAPNVDNTRQYTVAYVSGRSDMVSAHPISPLLEHRGRIY